MIRFNTRGLHDPRSFFTLYGTYQNYLKFYHPGRAVDLIPIEQHPDGIPFFNWDDISGINSSDKDVVALNYLLEGLSVWEPWHRHYPKDKKYIFFSNAQWDRNLDLGIEYELVVSNQALYTTIWKFNSPLEPNFFVDRHYQYETEKPNLFCSLVGMARPPRNRLVDSILKHLHYDNYILNYHGKELGRPSRNLDINFDFDGHSSSRMFLHDGLSFNALLSFPTDLFNTARFNLVVETSQIHNDFHLTEKTLKPLFVGQPFVVFADRHHLRHLRTLGFETFGNLWPEDYDEIADLDARIDAIIKLLNDLKNFNWNAHRYELEAITNHNRLVLANVGHTLAAAQMQQASETLKNCPWIPRQ